MGTDLSDYAQYDRASIFVKSSADLNSAIRSLAAQGGGTVKVDPNGGPYNLNVSGIGGKNSPVLVEPAGSGTPVFHSMTIHNSSHLAVTGMKVDTSKFSGRAAWEDDLRITNSENIEIVDNSFTGNARGFLSEAGGGASASGVKGTVGGFVENSDDILVANNSFSNYFNGFRAKDTVGLDFVGNEVTRFQADGFQGTGVQDIVISDNHLHNALGSTQRMAHTDYIQIHMSGGYLKNSGIEISGNFIDSAGGGNGQGIYLGNGGTGGRFEDVSIHDNVIHVAMPAGIGVKSADGVEIYDNTLLWNEASYIKKSVTSAPQSWEPRILVDRSTGVEMEDNVATWMRIDGVHQKSAGYAIQYKKPYADNYVDNHVVNLDGSGNPNSYDLSFFKSSPLYGKVGALMSSSGVVITSQNTPPVEDSSTNTVVEDEPIEAEAPVTPRSQVQADDNSYGPDVALYLYDTKTDEVISELRSGDTLSPEFIGSKSVTIVAVPEEDIGSVRFTLGDIKKIDNTEPYALFGDRGVNLNDAWTAPFKEAGDYSMKVELFENLNRAGKIGEKVVDFSVASEDMLSNLVPVIEWYDEDGSQDDADGVPDAA